MEEKNEYNYIEDQKAVRLSEQIQAWRASIHLSIEEVASQIHVRPQIILALEKGEYSAFPARVYAMWHLKRVIDHFMIPHGDELLDALKREWEQKRGETDDAIRALPISLQKKWYITPRRLFGVCGSFALLFFTWLMVTQLVGFSGAPMLYIDQPHANTIAQTPIIRVQGSTEKESQLTLNGREITMNGNGLFDQEIELPYGVNTLHFFVRNRFGKSSEEIRYIVVK